MSRSRRTHTLLRWPAGVAAAVIVLATAGSAPAAPKPADDHALQLSRCLETAHRLDEEYRKQRNVLFSLICEAPDGTVIDPKLWLPTPPAQPTPTPVATEGHPACVTGPTRPVVGTALTTVRATTTPARKIRFEYGPLDSDDTAIASGSESHTFSPGDLVPGASYRWRAQVDTFAEEGGDSGLLSAAPDPEQGWSSWCEFTVSADAPDYRNLGDVSIEALHELGLRPDREYTISLTGRQQRLLRDGTDVGRTSARLTLTGPRWTALLVQLTESAFLADELAAELEYDRPPGQPVPPDGSAYRALVDAISVKLGGPAHPRLG